MSQIGYFRLLNFTGGSVADDEGSESSSSGDNADESMANIHDIDFTTSKVFVLFTVIHIIHLKSSLCVDCALVFC